MQIRLVSRQRSLETCTSMISSLEVNGPSVFCDASAQFLVVLIDHLQGESITSKDIAERVLTWLFRTWSPSKSTKFLCVKIADHLKVTFTIKHMPLNTSTLA